MRYLVIGMYGIFLSTATFLRGKPNKIFSEVYWSATILLFSSSLYLLMAIFNPRIEINWILLGVLFVPSGILCGYMREAWYKERGRKRPWWDL